MTAPSHAAPPARSQPTVPLRVPWPAVPRYACVDCPLQVTHLLRPARGPRSPKGSRGRRCRDVHASMRSFRCPRTARGPGWAHGRLCLFVQRRAAPVWPAHGPRSRLGPLIELEAERCSLDSLGAFTDEHYVYCGPSVTRSMHRDDTHSQMWVGSGLTSKARGPIY